MNTDVLADPQYALARNGDTWSLTFAGLPAEFRHEKGADYAIYLLLHPPPSPIHALLVIALCTRPLDIPDGATEILDPFTGKPQPIESHATLQQRSFASDDAESFQALRLQRDRLQALLDSQKSSPKIEASLRFDIEAIDRFLRRQPGRAADAAQRGVRAVRMALNRFCRHLLAHDPSTGKPNPVLVGFKDHIVKFVLIPSSRYSAPRARLARKGLAGCFTYEPPPGVTWTSLPGSMRLTSFPRLPVPRSTPCLFGSPNRTTGDGNRW